MILLRFAFWLWLFAAIAAGHFLLLQRVPAPAIPGILFGLTGFLLAAYFGIRTLRDWIDRLDLRALVLLHLTRFVGFYFLYLYNRGALPYEFAVPGGYGDIAVAMLALPVIFFPMSDALRQRAIGIWNVVGFVDIMMVVVAAARLGLADPLALRALTHLPLSLLPTFLVPLIVASHVVIYVRLKNASTA